MWYYIINGNKYGPLSSSEVEIRIIGDIINHKMTLYNDNNNKYKNILDTEFANLLIEKYEEDLNINERNYLYLDTEVNNYDDIFHEMVNNQYGDERCGALLEQPDPLSCEDEVLRKKLWDACCGGSLDTVKELVESGAPWGSSEHFCCLRAAMRGGLDILRYLISRLEGKYEDEKFRCFKIACVNGMLDHVKFFLEEGGLLSTDIVEYLTNYIKIQYNNLLNDNLEDPVPFYNILDVSEYLINENIVQPEVLKIIIEDSRVVIKTKRDESEKWLQEYRNTDEYKETKEYQRVAEIGPSRFSLPDTVEKYKINNARDIEKYQIDFEEKIQEGDEIWVFTSAPWTWEMKCGNSYSELHRDGEVIDTGVVIMN